MAFTSFKYLQCTHLDAVMLITRGSDCSHIPTTIYPVTFDCGWASACLYVDIVEIMTINPTMIGLESSISTVRILLLLINARREYGDTDAS